ncbi:MAG: 2-oxoglutarate dehydrogenase E1 component [Methylococcales bacterium]|nr:2-oxoglutarate dehydrogenase E1 component [Methylococcales bacterium]
MSNLLKLFQDSSALYGSNAVYIEHLYEQYLENPDSVSQSWRAKFDILHNGIKHETAHSPIVDRFEKLASTTVGRLSKLQGFTEESVKKQSSVARLINHFRVRGHQIAANNPLGNIQETPPDLELAYYGLAEPDMDTIFHTGTLYGVDKLPLKKILSTLKEIYCGSIGTEYMHIVDSEEKRWIKNRLEGNRLDSSTHSADKKISLLKLLTAAEGIEKHLHRRYVGQKRFSLEGGECLIPILDELIQKAGENQVKEIIIGMAHRGRLNVLINVLGKSPAKLFGEFEGTNSSTPGAITGDVKYHMGFSSNIATEGGPVHLTMAFNPSHLEIINPVVEGSVKARQDRRGKGSVDTIIPILIHGDAAFAGQGIVMETLNMSKTRAFSTGGTVHIVINNQIGFTTSNAMDARSTQYCTDVATMIHAPVFHVNGDDPEAVMFVTQMALDFRMKFNQDVVIDLICYRRLGHNEADEPATTQPMMYKKIRSIPSVRDLYAQKLIAEDIITEQAVLQMDTDYQQLLDEGNPVSRPILNDSSYSYSGRWKKYTDREWTIPCDTSVSLEKIRLCSERLHQLPSGFELHPRVAKVIENRIKMSAGALPLDWGFAENMAYATLIIEGESIRLIGQDVGRGTFSHRHIALHNQIDGETWYPIQHLSENQGRAQIFDSLLSEAGVLGFEYGYSSTEPEKLIIWEAQFGDFANGAQVVIDQFISSGESKWGRLSGLVLLLPHGFEGQGPEHSSARLERYLQLCADHNMQVCNPTTPSQIFHLLRRQQLRTYRKPLIVMSPKSLLRHKLATSTLEDLTAGEFLPIISEIDEFKANKITRLIMCSGKVYYDLLERRRSDELDTVAIIRIEQLYPFPSDLFKSEINKYPNLQHIVWCQEEPKNQGAWYQSKHHFYDNIEQDFTISYAGRPASAAPAVGNHVVHIEQQKAVIHAALYDINEGN